MIKKQLKKRFEKNDNDILYKLYEKLCNDYRSAHFANARMHDWLYEIVD